MYVRTAHASAPRTKRQLENAPPFRIPRTQHRDRNFVILHEQPLEDVQARVHQRVLRTRLNVPEWRAKRRGAETRARAWSALGVCSSQR
eukprot:53022-Pleurochrysis_carterae.AAC.1